MADGSDRSPDDRERERELAAFPPAVRALIDAELAAGNTIDQIGHSHPAPPAGAYVKFTHPISTRARADGDGLFFRERNSSLSSGEYTDADRFYFVVEPPGPPPPPIDMDAIRAAHDVPVPEVVMREAGASVTDDAVRRFVSSMDVTYEMWHDGIGYDLEALRAATPAGRDHLEAILLSRGVHDWRDVEALLALGTPAATAAVADAGLHGTSEIRLVVAQQAPELVQERHRTSALVHSLETATFTNGLSRAIDLAGEQHPPEVIDALLRGARQREGEAAVHFAALLLYLHGKAKGPFDWDERPFALRFHAKDPERWVVFQELCARIGVDASPYESLHA